MPMNRDFHFKQFSVCHARSSMKVGTDGVLVGAWVNVSDAQVILDVGTGTGVIALMLAQRTAAGTSIDAVEMDEDACLDADTNFRQSPWPGKLHLYRTTLQHFKPDKKYDLIISNPPYFINSSKPPDKNRHRARHADTLSHQDLLQCSSQLLHSEGRLAVILPNTEGEIFIDLAKQYNLGCIRKGAFHSRATKPVERWLLEFSPGIHTPEPEKIILYEGGNQWSDQYIRLSKDFYLNI
jgi:tRNA1Val (adenine37-N6)-methyltransferase